MAFCGLGFPTRILLVSPPGGDVTTFPGLTVRLSGNRQRTCFAGTAEDYHHPCFLSSGVASPNDRPRWDDHNVARVQLVSLTIQLRAHAALLEDHILVEDRMVVLWDFGVGGETQHLNNGVRALVKCGSRHRSRRRRGRLAAVAHLDGRGRQRRLGR